MFKDLAKEALKEKINNDNIIKLISDIENVLSKFDKITTDDNFHNLNKIFINLATMQNQLIFHSNIIDFDDSKKNIEDFNIFVKKVENYLENVKKILEI
jgi:hypothetical protein